ncbi:MAG: sortase [Chloroflexi bacterium]|nr:sortase [Chloroflexota bacterium]
MLTMAAATMPVLGCSPALARAAAEPTATPAPTLTFPRPAQPLATSTPASLAALQSADSLAPRPGGSPGALFHAAPYATRSLPPTHLTVPTIELDSRVVPLGTYLKNGVPVWQTAAFAVGHHAGTANPGEPGNVVLSGHISSPREGGVFQRLPQVRPGDAVIVATAEQQYIYRVRDTHVVLPTALEYIEPTPTRIVTLITCVPDGIYSHRLIVRADAL